MSVILQAWQESQFTDPSPLNSCDCCAEPLCEKPFVEVARLEGETLNGIVNSYCWSCIDRGLKREMEAQDTALEEDLA